MISFLGSSSQLADRERRVSPPFCRQVPTCHSTTDAGEVAEALLSNPAVLALLQAQGPETRFCIRTRVCPYAEGLAAVWVMLAAYYPEATVAPAANSSKPASKPVTASRAAANSRPWMSSGPRLR